MTREWTPAPKPRTDLVKVMAAAAERERGRKALNEAQLRGEDSPLGKAVDMISVDYYTDSQGHGSSIILHRGSNGLGFNAEQHKNLAAEISNAGHAAVEAASFFSLGCIQVRRLTREGQVIRGTDVPLLGSHVDNAYAIVGAAMSMATDY